MQKVDTKFRSGHKPWNAGLGIRGKCLACNKIFRVQKNKKNLHCSIECRKITHNRKYKCLACSLEFFRQSQGTARQPKFCSNVCQGLYFRGSSHPMWNGGSSKEREKAKGRREYKEWRKDVFERDNYTCQKCGIRGGYIEADHIKQWALYPDLRYEVANGRTLCRPCHQKTSTWGRPRKAIT